MCGYAGKSDEVQVFIWRFAVKLFLTPSVLCSAPYGFNIKRRTVSRTALRTGTIKMGMIVRGTEY